MSNIIFIAIILIINFSLVLLAQKILIKKGYDITIQESPVRNMTLIGPIDIIRVLLVPKSDAALWQEKNQQSHLGKQKNGTK